MFKAFLAWLKGLFSKKTAPVTPPTDFSLDGYVADSVDTRDHVFAPDVRTRNAPTSVDLRSKFLTPVESQGRSNSCVAHATTAALEATLGVADQSRLFVYYNARLLANQQAGDVGCQPRNAFRGVSTYGSPNEVLWPFDSSKVTIVPPKEAYDAALAIRSRIKAYQSVTSFASMKTALAQGMPVVFGFTVPDTYVSQTATTGILPMWTSTTKWIGNHAVLAVGYDDAEGMVLCRNSHGPTWGLQGYFKMPYSWFTTLGQSGSRVRDAWVFVPA